MQTRWVGVVGVNLSGAERLGIVRNGLNVRADMQIRPYGFREDGGYAKYHPVRLRLPPLHRRGIAQCRHDAMEWLAWVEGARRLDMAQGLVL